MQRHCGEAKIKVEHYSNARYVPEDFPCSFVTFVGVTSSFVAAHAALLCGISNTRLVIAIAPSLRLWHEYGKLPCEGPQRHHLPEIKTYLAWSMFLVLTMRLAECMLRRGRATNTALP